MSRVNQEDFKLRGGRHGPQFILDSITQAGAAVPNPFIVTTETPPLLILGATGAINLRMPPSSTVNKGMTFYIHNNGGGAITVLTDGGVAFAQAIAIAANQTAMIFCTGDATANLGWKALVAAGTQTSP